MKRIPLGQQGKNKGKYVAIVDDADYEWLIQWKWHALRCGKCSYAARKVKVQGVEKRRYLFMHRAILGLLPSDKREIDHVNHRTLDNRRHNIRAVTHQENLFNQVGTGYYYVPKTRKYRALIRTNNKCKSLGYFTSPVSARRAYLAAKAKYHRIGSGQPACKTFHHSPSRSLSCSSACDAGAGLFAITDGPCR